MALTLGETAGTRILDGLMDYADGADAWGNGRNEDFRAIDGLHGWR
jgi:hypothetical protein